MLRVPTEGSCITVEPEQAAESYTAGLWQRKELYEEVESCEEELADVDEVLYEPQVAEPESAVTEVISEEAYNLQNYV